MISSRPRSFAPAGDARARFIPREDLAGVTAWQPGGLDGAPAAKAGATRASTDASANDAVARSAAQLHAARQGGYQDGYRDGLVALDAFKQSFAAQTSAQLGALLVALQHGLDDLQQEMAQALAVTATHLARQIVRSELAVRPELVIGVAQEALDTLLLSARHITLRVHPDDHALIAQGAAEVIHARGARLLADARIERGGCSVESDIGVIDASLPARWRRAAAALGSDEAWAACGPVAAPPA